MRRPPAPTTREGDPGGRGPAGGLLWVADLPLFVVLMWAFALAMLVPAAHGAAVGDRAQAAVFLRWGAGFLLLAVLIGIATAYREARQPARARLLTLVAAFTVLPVMLAAPFHEAVGTTSYLNAWFEMLSALTTTGATLFEPERLSSTVHLWRAIVGWLGGYLILLAAVAILAPMNLGGYEVLSTAPAGAPERIDRPGQAAERRDRVVRHALRLAPVYGGLTLVLWLGLVVVGERPFVAACHAMAVMATSGISPVGGLEHGTAGVGGEALILVFFVFALTRVAISPMAGEGRLAQLSRDPELRIALALLVLVPSVLFLRHWLGAWEVAMVADLRGALGALWGAAFTTWSFLSTTGFLSSEWDTAQAWSGLGTTGLILLGLGLIGGGAATTAGGVKLLRVYALYLHGAREMDRLSHPSSVGGAGPAARRLRREGAHIAWVFFMLFALSLTAVSVTLAATGVPFDEAMVLTVAALSNTGPIAGVVLDAPASFVALDTAAKAVLAAAMVLGRLETLAIIALANPAFWRR
ncbi:TrkH family potassium uptake protein [Rhodovulum sp. 12E13]|uniref:potassium transporter TrkG n=1 Tax=Rhodovulum sp. 12E13 TaxID=2203891 RepID=UPI000E177230|nr:TrkH family potassium uptake protein [Rhodovulum sp. 12E13]